MAKRAKPQTRRSASVATHIALLRGINVGGNHMLPMKDLTRIFEAAGCDDVRTYIQSGNVVFNVAPGAEKNINRAIVKRIGERFGFEPRIMLRRADELAAVITSNPFPRAAADAKLLHVGFLEEQPESDLIRALAGNSKRSPGDDFRVLGREIYLHTPNGLGKSRLTNAYFDSMLKASSTFRNWRTVLKLAEMTGATE